MKKLLLAMSALAALALLIPSTGVAGAIDDSGLGENKNIFGIYTTQTPNDADVAYNGAAGAPFTAYVVVKNPTNYHVGSNDSTTEAPIQYVGGFEFKLTIPATAFLLSSTYHPSATNFLSPPQYLAGCNIPVTNSAATLVTLSILPVAAAPAAIYISPVDPAGEGVPSINGKMAITDANDDFRLNPAYPPYFDYNIPVFFLFQAVDSEQTSWGNVKTLFR